jgi:hypothetical protein
MNGFYFIYQLGNEIKVLTYDEAKESEESLKETGWKHIGTLSAKEYIDVWCFAKAGLLTSKFN